MFPGMAILIILALIAIPLALGRISYRSSLGDQCADCTKKKTCERYRDPTDVAFTVSSNAVFYVAAKPERKCTLKQTKGKSGT